MLIFLLNFNLIIAMNNPILLKYISCILLKWLQTESLPNNPKIEVTPDGKFVFKALYRLKDRKSLLKLLKQQDLKGLGGVLLEDVQESLPHCEKALKVNNL